VVRVPPHVLRPAAEFREPPVVRYLNALSRLEMYSLLQRAGMEPDGEPKGVLSPTGEHTSWLEDDQLLLGLRFLTWSYHEPPGFNVIDPQLIHRVRLAVADDAIQPDETLSLFRQEVFAQPRSVLPIFASDHWTVLSVNVDVAERRVTQVRYRDSLTVESDPCRQQAAFVLSWLSESAVLPERQNHTFQKLGSAECGFWVILWAEDELLEHLGAAPLARGVPQPRLPALRTKLACLTRKLAAEQDRLRAQREAEVEKALLRHSKATQRAEAAARQTGARAAAAQAALEAARGLDETFGVFSEDMLSDHAKLMLQRARERENLYLRGCSRCRYDGNGCLSCSGEKCYSHFMRKESEAHILKMLEKI
jgi:hypothetical protein